MNSNRANQDIPMMGFETSTFGDGGVVVRVLVDIDEDDVENLRRTLVDQLKINKYEVVVDLSDMKFISCEGVGVLVERLRQFKAYNGMEI